MAEIDGILLLDKATGPTSNDCLKRLKYLFKCRKAGHTGSLDPLASGLLPVCLGKSTKLAQFLLSSDKRYRFTVLFGIETESGDSEGRVIQRTPGSIDEKHLADTLEEFKGKTLQVPPHFSALKKDGKPLYKLARAGIKPVLEPRAVCVHDLSWQMVGDNQVEIEVHCSKGFYVRSMAKDAGTKIGLGAHVTALRRLSVGSLDIKDAVSLDELSDMSEDLRQKWLICPGDNCLKHLDDIVLSDESYTKLCQGLHIPQSEHPDGALLRLYRKSDHLFGGIVEIKEKQITPKRMFFAHL